MTPLEFSRQLLDTLTRHTRLERWPLRQAEAALRRAGWQILARRPGQVTLVHAKAPVSVTLCDQTISHDIPADAWQRAWMFKGSPIIPPLLRSRDGHIFTQPAPDRPARTVPSEVRRALLTHYPHATPGQVVYYQRCPHLAGLP